MTRDDLLFPLAVLTVLALIVLGIGLGLLFTRRDGGYVPVGIWVYKSTGECVTIFETGVPEYVREHGTRIERVKRGS